MILTSVREGVAGREPYERYTMHGATLLLGYLLAYGLGCMDPDPNSSRNALAVTGI